MAPANKKRSTTNAEKSVKVAILITGSYGSRKKSYTNAEGRVLLFSYVLFFSVCRANTPYVAVVAGGDVKP